MGANQTQFLISRSVGAADIQKSVSVGIREGFTGEVTKGVLQAEKEFKQEAKEREREDRPWRQMGFKCSGSRKGLVLREHENMATIAEALRPGETGEGA